MYFSLVFIFTLIFIADGGNGPMSVKEKVARLHPCGWPDAGDNVTVFFGCQNRRCVSKSTSTASLQSMCCACVRACVHTRMHGCLHYISMEAAI